MPARVERTWTNWVLSAAVFTALLAGLEASARLWEAHHPRPTVAPYIWDWDRMWGSDFYTVGASVSWPPEAEWNALGLRDRARPNEKPPRTFRMVLLGDSVTMGHGIEAREAYPQQLQALLEAEGRRIEVFNVALQGWSTRQERLAYERLARPYRPDLVVVAVCLNDIAELQNNLSQPPAWLLRWHRRSALLRLLTDPSGREIRDVEQLFEDREQPAVRAGYERFFGELLLLRAAVRADGATLAVLVFPFRFQVEAGAPEPRAQRAIADFCRREALPQLDLLPTLAAAGPAAFVDYDHLSPQGALLTARALHASGWLPEPVAGPAASLGDLTNLDPAQRETAALSLEGRAAAANSTALVALLRRDPDLGVRAAAARALGRSGSEAAVAPLQTALVDPSENVRWAAAEALAAFEPRANRDLRALIAALGSADARVQGFAAFEIARLGPAAAEALPALMAALASTTHERGLVAQALAALGPTGASARPALESLLASPEPRLRANGAHALGRLGPAAVAALQPLLVALEDPDADVRAEAARALGRIDQAEPQVVAALVRTLDDDHDRVAVVAARALGWFGPRADAARPALERAQRQGSMRLAGEAGRALEKIRPL